MSNFIKISSHCNTPFLGIDLHTTAATYAAIDAKSDTIEKITIPNHCTGKIIRFIQTFKKPICIGIESMGSYYWLWDMLKPITDEIHLFDALDLNKLRHRECAVKMGRFGDYFATFKTAALPAERKIPRQRECCPSVFFNTNLMRPGIRPEDRLSLRSR